MKKIALTIAILIGMTYCATAQQGEGLFRRGMIPEEAYYGNRTTSEAGGLIMPNVHGGATDATAEAPLGGGALLLIGFGAAYALKKRNK